ncbi:hypothetical protein [Asanoa iriomotensis]|uniref:hypothetical protein n=1 Tax=Asanoa iriomotensis TaxID=234613 RepID=UPI00194428E0|nr:hypothetical protein [Asanoa iriomotensis]
MNKVSLRAAKARLGWAVVAAVCVAVVVASAGCSSARGGDGVRDPRAYEIDDGRVLLETGLERAALSVPSCLGPSLKYALVDDGFGYYYKVFLAATGSVDCMDELVVGNGMTRVPEKTRVGDASEDKPLAFRRSWMDDEVVAKMGWQLGPAEKFQEFGVGLPTQYAVTALVQHVPNSAELRVYVYAFRGG